MNPVERVLAASAVAGVVGLVVLVHVLAPPVVDAGALPQHEGARVSLDGRIVDVHVGARGAALTLATGHARVTLLMGERTALPLVGDEVRVTGLVGRDRGTFTISTQVADVVVLSPSSQATPLADILAEPARFAGTEVITHADIRRDAAGERQLSDPHGAGRILGIFPIAPPDGWAQVEGVVRYQASAARYTVEVTHWTPE